MKIAIPAEADPAEPRVAATPDTVKKLKALGADVVVAGGRRRASPAFSMPTTRPPARRSRPSAADAVATPTSC